MNVHLVQFVTQMLHVQIHLVRLNVRVIKDLLAMDLYVMVRLNIGNYLSKVTYSTKFSALRLC